MFEGLKNLLRTPENTPLNQENNLLNQIVFPYLNNNLVVWFDSQNSKEFIDKGYRANATVYAIVKKIMDKASAAPLLVYEETQKSKTGKYKAFKYSGKSENHAFSNLMRKSLVYNDNNQLAQLLKKPNPYQTQSEFFAELNGFYNVCGECFIYGVGPGDDSKDYGKYTQLYSLPSHLVTVVQGDWMNPVHGYKLMIGNQEIELPKEDVLHIKMWNPNWTIQGDQLRGQSPLLAGMKTLKSSDTGITAKVKSQQNEGAKGIVSPNHNDPKMWLNPQQRQETEQVVDRKMNGIDNLHKVIVSGMPLQYTQIGLSPQAMQIIEGLNYDAKTLCSIYNISPILLGLTDGTYANQEGAMKGLVTDVCLPWLQLLEEKLTCWLVEKYNRIDKTRFVIDFDTTVYPELQMDLKVLKEVYGDAYQITPNEYRAMLNMEESTADGMNDNWIPGGLTRMSDYQNDNGDEKNLFSDY